MLLFMATFAIVGAEGVDKAFVFRKPSDGWNGTVYQLAELENFGSSGDKFGYSVSIWGDYAAVGSPKNDANGNDAGKVQVYYRNQSGTDNWGHVKTLSNCTATDYFGMDVDLYNDILVVGAPQHDDWDGFIKVYNRNLNTANDWGLQQTLYPDNNNLVNAKFGRSVAVFDQFISTAYYDHDNYSYPNLPCWQYNIFRNENNNWEILILKIQK